MAKIVGRLPFGLDSLVGPRVLGYLLFNVATFALDLVLLTALHGLLGWPLWASITVAYLTALSANYALNRVFNFGSRSPLGPQLLVYVAVVVVNYAGCIVGVADGLAAVGVDYRVARILAGGCEAVYMYCAMRWVVFRDVTSRRGHGATQR